MQIWRYGFLYYQISLFVINKPCGDVRFFVEAFGCFAVQPVI